MQCFVIGHVGIVYSLTVLKAPGKMRLFSASYDKTIRVSLYVCDIADSTVATSGFPVP